MIHKCIPTKVFFPVDCKKGIEKRRYKKASKVTSYNIFEKDINNIPKLEDTVVTSLFLISILKYYSEEELSEYFGITVDEFKSILKSFHVECIE